MTRARPADLRAREAYPFMKGIVEVLRVVEEEEERQGLKVLARAAAASEAP